MTNDMEYKTYSKFWDTELSELIKQEAEWKYLEN